MPFVFQTGQIRDLLATTAEELWAISLGGTVFHSTDAGKNWDEKEVGKDYIMLTSIYFCSPDVGWIVNLRGTIFMTENRGESWKRILEYSEVPIFTLIDLAFRNSQEGWVLAESEPKSPRAMGKGMFIYHTKEGGRKWEVQEKGISDFLISIQTLPKGIVWVAGRQGSVLTTNDYGKTWRHVTVE